MSKIGFDVSRFVQPYQGDPLVGQKMLVNVLQQAAEGQRADFANKRGRDLERQKMGQQAAFQQAMLGDKLLARAALADRYKGAGDRADKRLAMDEQKMAQEQERYQGGIDQEAAKGLLGPFASGDKNALAAAKASAVAKDPTLGVYLPGEAGGGSREGLPIPGVDEAYGPDELRVERGDRTVFRGSPDAAQANERAIASTMLGPLGSKPYAGAGKSLAGAGMTGKDAGLFGTKQQNAEDSREAAMARAQTMSGQRQGGQDLQVDKFKHEAMRNIASDREKDPSLKQARTSLGLLSDTRELMKAGSLGEAVGSFKQLRSVMAGSLSNADMERYFGAGGKATQLEMEFNKYAAEGKMPPAFKRQVEAVTESLMSLAQERIQNSARGARDQAYNSPSVPFSSYDDMVAHGDQAQSGVSLRPLSPREFKMEVDRVKKLYPGRFGASSAPSSGDGWQPTVPEGTPMDLGDTGQKPSQIPRVPAQPAGPSPEDLEEKALLEEEIRRLEADGG